MDTHIHMHAHTHVTQTNTHIIPENLYCGHVGTDDKLYQDFFA